LAEPVSRVWTKVCVERKCALLCSEENGCRHRPHGEAVTRTLALEAIGHGIRVNAVGAGDVVTNLLNTFRDDGREFLTEHGKLAPIGRAAQPEEIAEVVAFLASEKSSFIVGAIVMADGGMSVIIQ
jgi:NAD(P)-dependent dehydrogenase (short-subunit alcohol dehydrogenase family)